MSKHTPGPWDYDPEHQNVCATGKQVANLWECYPLEPEEIDANGYLIAAAPDLLAACEAFLGGVGDSLETTDIEQQARALVAMQAAVAKARGQEVPA